MSAAVLCWIIAMICGLCWSRWWTGLATGLTALVLLVTRAPALAHWAGWMQLTVMVMSPWLLSAQRADDERALKELHAEEAKKGKQLSETARTLMTLQTSAKQLETQIGDITDVYHVTKATARALHLSELFSATCELAPRLLQAAGLRLIEVSGPAPHVLRARRLKDGRLMVQPPQETGTASHGLLEIEQAIVNEVRTALRPTSRSAAELGCAAPEGLSQVAWAPLSREQRAFGVLVADELPPERLRILAMIANQLSLQMSRIRLYEQVEALAVTDALTELSVRRYFLQRATEELERSRRHKLPCTLLMADLDHFKDKNDTYGHLVGDVVLREVAGLLKRHLREIDLIARYGGEEFILMLIETSPDQAFPIAERLRQLVEVHPIRAYDELLTQTISIGLAGFPEDANTLEELIERADQALYAAKHAGRNQVMRASAVTA